MLCLALFHAFFGYTTLAVPLLLLVPLQVPVSIGFIFSEYDSLCFNPHPPHPPPFPLHPHHSPLTITLPLHRHPSPLTAHRSPLTTHHSPLTFHPHPNQGFGACVA